MSKKQAIKSISLLWLGSTLGAGCAFLTQVILARQLGPSEFGAFTAALATVTLLAPLAGFGVAQYWLKAFGQEGWDGLRWFPASFHFIGISTLAVLFLLIFWSLLGPHEQFMSLLLMTLSCYVLGQTAIELVCCKFQLEERYMQLALWQLLPHLARLVLVVVLAFGISDWMAAQNVAYVYATLALIFAFVGFLQLIRMAQGNFDLKGHPATATSNIVIPSIKLLALQIWPFGLAGLFQLIYFQSDIILVKYITGNSEAGIYNVAFTVTVAVLLFPSIVYQKFLLPKIHRWANYDRLRFYKVYRQGNLVMLLIGLLAMAVIWLLAGWVIPFLFGDSYKEAVPLLYILALTFPLLFVASSVGATLVTQVHMKMKVKLMGVVAIVNILLNFALIPSYGATGAAIATVLCNAILLAFYYLAAQKIVFALEINALKKNEIAR